jgi:hypothetical protein
MKDRYSTNIADALGRTMKGIQKRKYKRVVT